jgi:secretion/DNA translocation related TadE-like protein
MTAASEEWRRSPNERGSATHERGSATVVMLGVIASVLILTVSGLLLASAVLASHRARAGADLAALAAAAVLMQGGTEPAACGSAARVAALNRGRLEQCLASGVEVWLSVDVEASMKGVGVASASSRAGPDPARGLSLTP